MNAKEFVTSYPPTEGPKPPLYPVGCRVKLPVAEGYEGGPQEIGTVVSYDWVHGSYSLVVEVDIEFCDAGDDGLRELGEEQVVGVVDLNG